MHCGGKERGEAGRGVRENGRGVRAGEMGGSREGMGVRKERGDGEGGEG